MKLLLDSHTLIWHSDASPKMSAAATSLLNDPANELFLSMASAWEIAISGVRQYRDGCRARFLLHVHF